MNIKHKSVYLLTGALVLSLAGCKNLLETAQEKQFTKPEGVTLMSEAEIRDTLVGNTFQGESARRPGKTYVEYIHPDGKISGLWNETDRYQGEWAVAGSVWCYRYKNNRGCNTLAKDGDSILWYKLDGSTNGGKSMVVSGDPRELAQ